jgi:hypothetical protein
MAEVRYQTTKRILVLPNAGEEAQGFRLCNNTGRPCPKLLCEGCGGDCDHGHENRKAEASKRLRETCDFIDGILSRSGGVRADKL